jgi:hypothetical protein
MRQNPAPALGPYAGSRWFMGVVALVLVAVFAAWLLNALREAQALAEKMVVEQTIQNMRTGLKVAMGEALIAGRGNEVRTWAGSNPVRWLGGAPKEFGGDGAVSVMGGNLSGVPDGYRGDCLTGEIARLPAGAWCFDREARQLAYRPRQEFAEWAAKGRYDDGVLRWQVRAIVPQAKTIGFIGLRLEQVER